MEVTYEFKNPDWTLIWAQPGEKIPYFDNDKRKKENIRDGYGAVYQGDRDKLIVWVGDSQVYTEPKALGNSVGNALKGEIVGDEQARRLMSRPQRYPYVI